MCFAFAAGAFSGTGNPNLKDSAKAPVFITVTGTLQQGIECGYLVTCDQLNGYPLQGSLHNFGPGDVVEIKGKVVDGGFCLSPGATGIDVQRIRAATCN